MPMTLKIWFGTGMSSLVTPFSHCGILDSYTIKDPRPPATETHVRRNPHNRSRKSGRGRSMKFSESDVENAALEWLSGLELCRIGLVPVKWRVPSVKV